MRSCIRSDRAFSVPTPSSNTVFNRHVRFGSSYQDEPQHEDTQTQGQREKQDQQVKTAPQKAHPKRFNTEINRLIENQRNLTDGSYYGKDESGIVTRSARKRRLTIENPKKSRKIQKTAPNASTKKDKAMKSPKQQKTAPNASTKKEAAKKSTKEQKAPASDAPAKEDKANKLPRNEHKHEFENFLVNLRDGAKNMSKATSNLIKTNIYELSKFPECGNFLAVCSGLTFCKLSRNAGIAYMEPGTVRPWVSQKTTELAVSLNTLRLFLN